MKLGIQELSNKKHSIDVNETDKVRKYIHTFSMLTNNIKYSHSVCACIHIQIIDVKQKIESDLHIGGAGDQKLICAGKVLKDDQTVAEAGLKDGSMIVCMISKKKAQPAASATTTTSSSTTTPATQPSTSAPAATPSTQPTAQQSAAATPTATTVTQPQSLSGVSESTITDLMSMGFDRAQVISALRAAFNDPNRAAEYLFSGIPAHLQQQAQGMGAGAGAVGVPSAGAAGSVPPITADRAAAALARGGAAGPIDTSALGIPAAELEQIRTLLASQPQLLPVLLQQLAQTNPELIQAIQQNPQAFMNMLGVNPQGAEGAGQGQQHEIHVTPEEQEAILRLGM